MLLRITALAMVCAVSACLLEAPRYDDTAFSCVEPASSCPVGYDCIGGVCTKPVGDETADATPPDESSADAARAPAVDGAPAGITLTTLSGTGIVDDTHLRQERPTTNYGDDDGIGIDADPIHIGLLRFDVSTIPSGAEVVSAELELYVNNPIEDGDFVVYSLVESWDENQATWLLRRNGVPWASPGAGTGSYAPVPLLTFTPIAVGTYTIALPPSIVQQWVSQPQTNHGLRWESNSADGRGGNIDSSEGDVPPIIRIQHR